MSSLESCRIASGRRGLIEASSPRPPREGAHPYAIRGNLRIFAPIRVEKRNANPDYKRFDPRRRLRSSSGVETVREGLISLALHLSPLAGLAPNRTVVRTPTINDSTPDDGCARHLGSKRSGRDSNPRYPFGVRFFSKEVLSTTQPPNQIFGFALCECTGERERCP